MEEKSDYLYDLFIEEAKPALNRHSGLGGGNSEDSEVIQSFIRYLEDAGDKIVIPNGTTYIKQTAFQESSMTEVIIADSVKNVDNGVFYACMYLKKVTFKGMPDYIANTAFNNCYSLRDIYVPWSINEVSGAPWGAPNVQIHYDSEV